MKELFLVVLFTFTSGDTGIMDIGYITFGPFPDRQACETARESRELIEMNVLDARGVYPINLDARCFTEDELFEE